MSANFEEQVAVVSGTDELRMLALVSVHLLIGTCSDEVGSWIDS